MILISGAGPSGSLSAKLLGRRWDVIIAEEHQSPGFPVQCAGLISEKCFEKYKEHCKIEKAVENKISGALFFSPSGDYFEAKGNAYVIERKILDEMLLEEASSVSEVIMKTKVRFKDNKALLGNKEIEFDYLIGADGVNSEVARAFGFKKPKFFTALQIEARFEAIDENFVEIYFGSAYSEFFAYAIPIGDTAKIGVIAKKNAISYLKNLIENHPSVSKRFKGSTVEINSGLIPAELVNFVKEKVALIGDSAGMVKPYTGGGLYYLLIAAEKLAKNFPYLNKYRKDFLKDIGREIKIGKIIRKIYWLSDAELERFVKGLKDFDFSRMHMDYPSKIFSKNNFKEVLKLFAKNPSLFQILLKILFK